MTVVDLELSYGGCYIMLTTKLGTYHKLLRGNNEFNLFFGSSLKLIRLFLITLPDK